MRLKLLHINNGMHPNERLITFVDADNNEGQTFAWHRQLNEIGLEIGRPLQTRADGAVLVELPQETTAGYHRIWVKPEQLIPNVGEQPVIYYMEVK